MTRCYLALFIAAPLSSYVPSSKVRPRFLDIFALRRAKILRVGIRKFDRLRS